MTLILGFDGRDVGDEFQQPGMVDPFERGIRARFEAASRYSPVDHLCFGKAIDRLGQSMIVAVADPADRRLDRGFCTAFDVLNGNAYEPHLPMMDEAVLWACSQCIGRLASISANLCTPMV